jgi:ABC-type phosphate transport system permease subunit
MFLTIKKIVGITAALIFVAAWWYSGFLENTFVYYPKSPNAEEDMIVPFIVKGIVVYITEKQRAFLSWLEWIRIVFGGIAVLVILMHGGDPFKRRNSL